MKKPYRPWSPHQGYLFPPSPHDWLPEDDLVYFIMDVVGQLDLTSIYASYESDLRGQPPYHPQMMLTVLIYGYCIGVFSSRRLQRQCERDAAFRVIVGGDVPDFRTLSDFRKRHLPVFQRLFVEVVLMCREAGLVKLGHLSLDGTKMKANASRHKAMSYGRMKTEEVRLEAEIAELLQRAEKTDANEDAQHGAQRWGDELPTELARRETRLEKIRQAKQALADRARQAAEENGEDPETAEPGDSKQYNFSDPESALMKVSNKGFDQCGNAQAATDRDHQIIVACDVTAQANDKKQWQPMWKQAKSNLECRWKDFEKLSGDNGYYSEDNVQWSERKRLDVYIATRKVKHNQNEPASPRETPGKDLTTQQRMARKLGTEEGKKVYAQRKWIAEPPFGQIKRGMGFRSFLLNGMKKMQAEWNLVCMAHNLLKYYRHCWAKTA